jgi:hypothetical protein
MSNVRDWRRWEASCFQMLNGDRFQAKIIDARTVCLDKLPGQSPVGPHEPRHTEQTHA